MCKLPAFSIANKLLTLGEKTECRDGGGLAISWYWPSSRLLIIFIDLYLLQYGSVLPAVSENGAFSLPVLFLKWPSNCAAVSFSHLWLLRETEVRSVCLVLYSGNTIKPLNNAYKVNIKTEEAYRSYFWMLLKLDRIK